jgi:cathepsin L
VTPNGALQRVEHQKKQQQQPFREFVAKHGLGYHEGHPEHDLRRSLFEAWVEQVERHNARADVNWRAGVNRFAAHTPEELARLRGYVRGGERTEGAVSVPGAGRVSMLQVPSRPSQVEDLPETFGWQGRLNATSSVMDQGGCGSCWAVASAAVLRAHSELFQRYRHFSAQQLVDCAPNPHRCGGEGGCSGATTEIAMDYAAKMGLLTEEEWPYTAEDGECPSASKLAKGDALDADVAGVEDTEDTKPGEGSESALVGVRKLAEIAASLLGFGGDTKSDEDTKSGLIGFHKLPTNKLGDLMLSLHNVGPVAVSIYAGHGWSMYESGIYDECAAGDPINHAVVLVGYGKDKQSGLKYWQIQNSWGPYWGEEGFIRLGRLDNEEEEANCGWDKEPLKGSGCPGGPSKVWTCGACGILFDTVVPRFSESQHGWWAKHGGAAA